MSRIYTVRAGTEGTVQELVFDEDATSDDLYDYDLAQSATDFIVPANDRMTMVDNGVPSLSGVSTFTRTPKDDPIGYDGVYFDGHPTKFVRFGSNVWSGRGSSVGAQHNWYDLNISRPVSYRHFDSGGLSTWNNSDMTYLRNNRPWCRRIYWSFKGDGANDWTQAEVTAWMNSIPTDTAANGGYDFFICWWHEPEDNFTTATAQSNFRARQRAFSNYVRSFGRTNVKIGQINVADAFNTNPQAAGRHFTNWYAGNGYLDWYGIDAYWSHNDRNGASEPYGNYPLASDSNEPVKWNWAIQSISSETDINKWAICETGFTWDKVNDPNGTVRIRMMKKAAEWWALHANAQGIDLTDVMWWDSKGVKTGSTFDSRLEGSTVDGDLAPTADEALRIYSTLCENSHHKMGL